MLNSKKKLTVQKFSCLISKQFTGWLLKASYAHNLRWSVLLLDMPEVPRRAHLHPFYLKSNSHSDNCIRCQIPALFGLCMDADDNYWQFLGMPLLEMHKDKRHHWCHVVANWARFAHLYPSGWPQPQNIYSAEKNPNLVASLSEETWSSFLWALATKINHN